MQAAVIINPVSGRAARAPNGRASAELASRMLRAHGVAGEVFLTERPGHAFELAKLVVSQGASLVFAWGGDGTVNEVGCALTFRDAALAIVPSGSGNGLARELNLPFAPNDAIAAALVGVERTIDAGELGGHLLFNVAGIGFDAEVARVFNNRPPSQRGVRGYVATVLREVFAYSPASYTIEAAGETFRRRALFIAVANAKQYGSGATIAPDARVDDGKIDVIVVDARPALRTLLEARRLFDGSVTRAGGVLALSVDHATISSDAPMRFHVDGETIEGSNMLEVRVRPGALRVRVPRY